MRAHVNKFLWAKGQVSLEFLLVAVAFLAFLSVWISLVFTVKDGVERSIEIERIRGIASDVRNTADAVCIMGPGSSKSIEIEDVRLEFKGKELIAHTDSDKIQYSLRCECEDYKKLDGEVLQITNIRGILKAN